MKNAPKTSPALNESHYPKPLVDLIAASIAEYRDRTDKLHFLGAVINEIARYGHRDVAGFERAFLYANANARLTVVSTEVSDQVINRTVNEVTAQLIEGQKKFLPGHIYFDPLVAAAYAALVAQSNSLNLS